MNTANTTCREITPYLDRYRDGEADEGLRQKIQSHLAQCPDCTLELQLLDQVTAAVKNLPEIEPRLNFTAQVMAQIKEKEQPRWFALPSLAYSIVFIVFCILGLLLNPQMKSPKTEPVPMTITTDSADYADYSTLLSESQQLNLIEIQDKTIEMVYNGEHK